MTYLPNVADARSHAVRVVLTVILTSVDARSIRPGGPFNVADVAMFHFQWTVFVFICSIGGGDQGLVGCRSVRVIGKSEV